MPGAGVAGQGFGNVHAAPVRATAQHAFDAAVLVAERDFEMEDPFAVTVEAEMPGLDDPGMDRADRDLMHLGTGDLEEIGIADRRAAGREAHRLQPRVPLRPQAAALEDLALEIMRRRAVGGQRRIGAGREACGQPDLAAGVVGKCGEQAGRAVLGQAGQQQQPAAAGDRSQHIAAKPLDARDRHRIDRQRNGIGGRRERRHRRPANTLAACTIASDSGSGIHKPSTSRSPMPEATIASAGAPSLPRRTFASGLPNTMSFM